MAKMIIDLFKRMKIGAKYRQMINQANNEYLYDNSDLIAGAKITYIAQSTFHVID